MSPFGSTNQAARVGGFSIGGNVSDDFVFGNIVRSSRVRGWLYDLGMAAGLGITGLNAWYAYLITQGAADYPLWLGGAAAVYAAAAPGLFGVSKANTPAVK